MLPMVELKTNLMIACEHKNEEIFDILTRDKNINFLLEDNRNRTALFYAIINKNKTANRESYDQFIGIIRCRTTNPKSCD